MEIPLNLKNLYRHWTYHTKSASEVSPSNVFKDKKLFENISRFVCERISIWEKKILGKPAPYTKDLILSQYRFCNIFREFDRQTIEFHALLNPLRNDFPLWLLNMFYCRMVASTETVKIVGLLSFDTRQNQKFYKNLMSSPRPRFGTPYVFPISTIQKSKTPTRELFIAEYLPKVMKLAAKEIKTWKKESVQHGVEKVLPIFGYNLSFLWTEVLIDVVYQYPKHINLFAEFPVGPGSIPTMQRINPDTKPSLLAQKLSNLKLNTGLTYKEKPLRLSAENWEGIGCEYRKYTNLQKGFGRRRIYKTR